MRAILLALSLLLASAPAIAHSGGTDRCGGHHDRKRGGYHVHNRGKYCACYPEACRPKGETGKRSSKEPEDQRDDREAE